MQKTHFLKIGALCLMSACLPSSGDENVDRNKDGIADTGAGGVRGVDTVTLQAPSSPNATIWGVLVDGVTGEPLADQDVTIFTAKNASNTSRTDATGAFAIEGVAQGDYLLTATRDGYVTARLLGQVAINGNIDNQSKNIGRVYMLPSTGTLSVTVLGEDGQTVNNATVIVRVLTVGSLGGDFQDFKATTGATGVAVVTGVPNFAAAAGVIDGTTTAVEVIVGGVDSAPADGFYEYGGKITRLTTSEVAALNNSAVVRLPLNGGAFELVATNLTRASAGLTSSALVSGAGPFVFVFSQPVDVGSVAFSFINAFNNGGLNNSEPTQTGERAAVDAFDINTKPASGAATATVATDPSGTVLYVTPSVAIPAGYEFRVSGSVASARRVSSSSSNVVVFDSGSFGGYTTPSEPALSIPRVYLERGGAGFGNVTFVLSRVIRGYAGGGTPYVFVCADDDLNGNGSRTDGSGTLDAGECPSDANFSYSRASADRLIRANLRGSGLQPGTGQFWEFNGGSSNAGAFFSGSRTSAKLRVVVPLVDNQVYVDGTTAAFVDGSAIGFGFVAGADVTLQPVSANVVYDLTPGNFVF
jgi:Carboxypeptidase regulatory-like domain